MENIMPKETINSAVRNTYSEPVPGNPDASFSHIIEEPSPEGNGFFVLLNRDGVNRAIRALRKARDAAYGKDE
jgi:hypothetical protein